MTRHQNGISAVVSQTSFRGKTSGGVAKRERHFAGKPVVVSRTRNANQWCYAQCTHQDIPVLFCSSCRQPDTCGWLARVDYSEGNTCSVSYCLVGNHCCRFSAAGSCHHLLGLLDQAVCTGTDWYGNKKPLFQHTHWNAHGGTADFNWRG